MNWREQVSLQRMTTFRVPAAARYFATFDQPDQLSGLLPDQQPLLILGGGSNLLFTQDYPGYVLKNEIRGIELLHEDEQYVFLKAGAGENWNDLVHYTLSRNWGGLENLALIPGSVGAAPIQNIGAYGVELVDSFWSLEAYLVADRKIVTFTTTDCEFGYRDSIFKRSLKDQLIILSVTFRLLKQPVFHVTYPALEQELLRRGVQQLSVSAIAQAVSTVRMSKLPDPVVLGSAGSFFKNPQVTQEKYLLLKGSHPNLVGHAVADGSYKLSAGWLIEAAGFKGKRRGEAGTYEKQALVLVNYGGATGKEIVALSEDITKAVWELFQVKLIPEVNIY